MCTNKNADCLLEDFPSKTTKILSPRMMSSSKYLFLESESSFMKSASLWPNTKYIVCIPPANEVWGGI